MDPLKAFEHLLTKSVNQCVCDTWNIQILVLDHYYTHTLRYILFRPWRRTNEIWWPNWLQLHMMIMQRTHIWCLLAKSLTIDLMAIMVVVDDVVVVVVFEDIKLLVYSKYNFRCIRLLLFVCLFVRMYVFTFVPHFFSMYSCNMVVVVI